MARYGFAFALIVAAALSRLLPHPPNFTAVGAIALFGAVSLDRKLSLVVPLAAMLLSDFLIGFHSGMGWVYASFLAVGCIGLWLRSHPTLAATAGATLAGSILFFVVTNFGVWLSSGMYAHDLRGVLACYTAAIPFFRNALAGDAFFVASIFGLFELGKRYLPEQPRAIGSGPAAGVS